MACAAEAPPTCYGEVVQWVGQVRVLRLVFVADEGAVRLQQEVARPPVLDVLACRVGGRRGDTYWSQAVNASEIQSTHSKHEGSS